MKGKFWCHAVYGYGMAEGIWRVCEGLYCFAVPVTKDLSVKIFVEKYKKTKVSEERLPSFRNKVAEHGYTPEGSFMFFKDLMAGQLWTLATKECEGSEVCKYIASFVGDLFDRLYPWMQSYHPHLTAEGFLSFAIEYDTRDMIRSYKVKHRYVFNASAYDAFYDVRLEREGFKWVKHIKKVEPCKSMNHPDLPYHSFTDKEIDTPTLLKMSKPVRSDLPELYKKIDSLMNIVSGFLAKDFTDYVHVVLVVSTDPLRSSGFASVRHGDYPCRKRCKHLCTS